MNRKEELHNGKDKRLVFLVEDDGGVADTLVSLLDRYKESVTFEKGKNATDVLPWIEIGSDRRRPDAILLDLMMPYGAARHKLDKDYTDPDDTETGIRLLEYLRRVEKEAGIDPIWVAIITARSPLALKSIGKELLESRCKIYYKPFDSFELEDDLMNEIGVTSKVPPHHKKYYPLP